MDHKMFLISLSACVHQVTREYFARKNYLKNAMSKLLVLIYLLAARNLGNNKNLSFIYIQLNFFSFENETKLDLTFKL